MITENVNIHTLLKTWIKKLMQLSLIFYILKTFWLLQYIQDKICFVTIAKYACRFSLILTLKHPQSIAVAMEQWYQFRAELLFQEHLRRCLQIAFPLRFDSDVKLRVKPMKRRWGSCPKVGTITLNTELVKTPLHCIDYVIIHELCHLRIHDHSPAFFRMLGRCMPDWKRRKDRLESIILM